jgi:methanogenic corrinoid protein MtbC1/DNA-binding transcriptional MerR regulator
MKEKQNSLNQIKSSVYPIRAVSKMTGVSVDNLRAWERRYHAVTPQRDVRGRLYTESDVRRLRLLNAAVGNGHAIGRLAGLSDDELQSLLAGASVATEGEEANGAMKVSGDPKDSGPRLVFEAIERLGYAEAERELSLLAAVLPPRELVHRVALPLMRWVGKAWHEGKIGVAQEHMTSALLRNLFGALIPLHQKTAATGRVLLATPSGERHEFGILVTAMLAVGGGLGVTYLGPDLPAGEVVDAARRTAPQAVVLGFIGSDGAEGGVTEIMEVARNLPAQIELWVGGAQNGAVIERLKASRALLMDDFEMLERHLIRLGARF